MEFLYAVPGYRAQHHASFSLVVVVAVGQTSATHVLGIEVWIIGTVSSILHR